MALAENADSSAVKSATASRPCDQDPGVWDRGLAISASVHPLHNSMIQAADLNQYDHHLTVAVEPSAGCCQLDCCERKHKCPKLIVLLQWHQLSGKSGVAGVDRYTVPCSL